MIGINSNLRVKLKDQKQSAKLSITHKQRLRILEIQGLIVKYLEIRIQRAEFLRLITYGSFNFLSKLVLIFI